MANKIDAEEARATTTRRNVVFDTNVYRELVKTVCRDSDSIRHYAGQLRAQEQSVPSRALAHPVVMLELLSHAAEPSDRWHAQCIKAISLLILHCHHVDDERCVAMVATCEMQIQQMLFGDVPPGFEEFAQGTQRMCYAIADTYLSTGNTGAAREACSSHDLALVADVVRQSEENYVAAWRATLSHVQFDDGLASKDLPPGKPKQRRLSVLRSEEVLGLFARALVLKAARQAGRELSDMQTVDYTNTVLQHFRLPLEVHRELCVRSTEEGFSIDSPKKKRANTMWDMDMASVVGNSHEMEDGPLILVTDDKAIIGACEKAACRSNLMTMEEYLASIDLPVQ